MDCSLLVFTRVFPTRLVNRISPLKDYHNKEKGETVLTTSVDLILPNNWK
jgi:hypothetical protein